MKNFNPSVCIETFNEIVYLQINKNNTVLFQLEGFPTIHNAYIKTNKEGQQYFIHDNETYYLYQCQDMEYLEESNNY